MITTSTTEDFRSTKTFTAAPDAVFSALTDIDALTGWWTPAGGGADAGETLRFLMGDQEVVMRVEEADRPSRARWTRLPCQDFLECSEPSTSSFEPGKRVRRIWWMLWPTTSSLDHP